MELFALLLFLSKEEKKNLKKQSMSAKPQATVTPGVSQQNSLYSKWLLSIFSSLHNSRSLRSRNLKLLLQISVLCNVVYNSLAKLNHLLCYLVKNMVDVTVQNVAISGTSKLYVESQICSLKCTFSKESMFLYSLFFPFKSLILGPDFQLSWAPRTPLTSA